MELNPTPTAVKHHVKTPSVPRGDIELLAVAQSVSDCWMENQWLTLKWTSAAQFKEQLAGFKDEVRSKNKSRSKRPSLTLQLLKLQEEMDEALPFVKGYIKETFGATDAPSYYPIFGIVLYQRSNRFPLDKNKRSEALDAMVYANELYQFGDRKFGTDFWKDLNIRYKDALLLAKQTDSAVSLKVGLKNVQVLEIRDTLNALINALKANFPKMWKAELRNWGFHKEKY